MNRIQVAGKLQIIGWIQQFLRINHTDIIGLFTELSNSNQISYALPTYSHKKIALSM